jgi:hypothetical protein
MVSLRERQVKQEQIDVLLEEAELDKWQKESVGGGQNERFHRGRN